MSEIYFRRVPRFGMGSEGGVFEFDRVIESVDRSGHREPARVTRTPNDRKPQILIRIITSVVLGDVSPIKERVNAVGSGDVPDSGQIFIGQRRVDERIVPGIMPGHPVTNHRGKFPNLKTDPWMIQRRVAKKVLVQSNLRALIRGIKTTIQARLGE